MDKEMETLRMANLHEDGVTYREIGGLYGMTGSAVCQRLKRAGFIFNNSRRLLPQDIEKRQLENLYAVDRLSIAKIAAAFGVSADTIKSALLLHAIPKRLPLIKDGKHVALLRKLSHVGDELQIRLSCKYPAYTLYKAAKSLGVKISLQNLGGGTFNITRIEDFEKAVPLYRRINSSLLREMYLVERSSIEKIAAVLDCSDEVIREALQYHRIPKREPLKFGGKRIDVLKKLTVGEEIEINYDAKSPLTNLHSRATYIRIKISVRSLGDKMFRIRRIE